MSKKIEPALTAEQWADLLAEWRMPLERRIILTADDLGATSPAALIALGNASLPDDDPRKITREWVDAIREAYTQFGQTDDVTDRLLSIADALESYLPPGPLVRSLGGYETPSG